MPHIEAKCLTLSGSNANASTPVGPHASPRTLLTAAMSSLVASCTLHTQWSLSQVTTDPMKGLPSRKVRSRTPRTAHSWDRFFLVQTTPPHIT